MSKMLIGITLILLFSLPPGVFAGESHLMDYHLGNGFLPQTPSVSGGPAGAFGNPASWATTGSQDGAIDFWWNDRNIVEDNLDNWGFSTGGPISFAMNKRILDDGQETFAVYDYQAGFAVGDRRSHFGMAWRWLGGESGRIGRENSLVTGFIHRPFPYLSFGLSTDCTMNFKNRLGVADCGIRPFGKPWVTFFGEYSMMDSDNLETGNWGAGFEVRPWRGIHMGMKFREDAWDDYRYSFNIGLTFDQGGFHVLPDYSKDGDRGTTTYLVRAVPPYSGVPADKFVRKQFGPKLYVPVNLEKMRLTYQKARHWDDEKVAWLDLARTLDRINEEPSVRGVVINMAGFRTSMSIGWEFREKLQELRDNGKEVILHIDSNGFGGYYMASVADRISIDPMGDLMIPGIAAHRTYMRGLFDKLGVGVEEWRYFTHKSAMEGFTRTDMSDADREQIGRLIDVIYEEVRHGICEGRKMTEAEFDGIVDDMGILTANQAFESGLVDTLARWDGMGEWIRENRDGARMASLPQDGDYETHPDDVWGRPKEIALVYALGVCDLEKGIKGRATSKHMRQLAKDRDVAAVVLRADSPGGSAYASDLIAEATRKLKDAEKPVIVTQGGVAGSGGYWISMDGTKIYTTPLTITGSIGVIGGWFWDNGIGEKTGFTADGVQRGAHADLFTGIRFPIFGTLPERNLTTEEKLKLKSVFLDLYGEFVRMVAAGRGISEEEVRKIGEGRIWMGQDAIDRDLCDAIGGIQDALAEAKMLAGIDLDEEVIVTEYPPRPLFRFPSFGPSLPGLSILGRSMAGLLGIGGIPETTEEEDYDTIYFRSLIEAQGAPMLLTPPEYLPGEWLEPIN